MTLTELQHAAASLGAPERRKLLAFLVALNLREDPGYKKEIDGRLKDQRPEAWIPFEEAKRRIGD